MTFIKNIINKLFKKGKFRSVGWVNVWEEPITGKKRYGCHPKKSKLHALGVMIKIPKSKYVDTVEIFIKEERYDNK